MVTKIDTAVANHLGKTGRAPADKIHSGTAPDYAKGAVIMGVYQLAGQSAPASVSDPVLSNRDRLSTTRSSPRRFRNTRAEVRTLGS